MSVREKAHSVYSTPCCSCCDCFTLCFQKKKKKTQFTGVHYELVPSATPEYRKVFVHPQAKAETHLLWEQESRYVKPAAVTQQPQQSRSASSDSQHSVSPHILPGSDHPDSSSSFSEEIPLLRPTLRSKSSVQGTGEDTIVISQSPTRTFTSAYRQSQRSSYSPTTSPEAQHPFLMSKTGSDIPIGVGDAGPEIDVSLYYNVQTQSLSVYLHSARHLLPKSSKHYHLLLYLVPEQVLESKIGGDDPSPSISQSFELVNIPKEEIRSQVLTIQVYDGSTAGAMLSTVALTLEEADLYGMKYALQLNTSREKARGELLLSLTYSPEARTLQGILLKVGNSSKTKTAIPDTYVKVYLMYKGKRAKQWKSTTKQSTLRPVFNEAFNFDLRDMNVRQVTLELLVMSHDRFSRDNVVGGVSIGSDIVHGAGKQHWEQVIAQPHSHVSLWHSFSPTASK